MKLYEIVYPNENNQDIVEVLTEDEIIARYYPHWEKKMIDNYPDEARTRQRCIDDWCTVHWAVEITIPI